MVAVSSVEVVAIIFVGKERKGIGKIWVCVEIDDWMCTTLVGIILGTCCPATMVGVATDSVNPPRTCVGTDPPGNMENTYGGMKAISSGGATHSKFFSLEGLPSLPMNTPSST